jgi:hypothetical protein
MAHRGSLVLAIAALLIGCAGRSAPEPSRTAAAAPVTFLDAADSARCATLADSVRAATPLEALPISTPIERPDVPRPPRDVAAGVPLRTTFLVTPDGRADTAAVSVSGTQDAGYRREMVRTLLRTRFRPATMAGCPNWGRGDFITVGVSRRRTFP